MNLTQRQKAEQLVAELEKYFASVHSDKQCPFGASLTVSSGTGCYMHIAIAGCTVWRYDSMADDTQFEVAPVLDKWVEQVAEWVDWTPRAKPIHMDKTRAEVQPKAVPTDEGSLTFNVTVPVTVPNHLGEVDVCGVIDKLLEIGYADAAESAEDPDLDEDFRDEAEEVTELTIGEPFMYDDDMKGEPS